MKCPFCGSQQVMVVNSRSNINKTQIWRRRKCSKCGEIFTTYEKLNLSYLVVVKKSGRKVRYQRSKLVGGIYHSCLDKKHVDRGDVGEFAEKTTNLVEQEILSRRKKEIASTEIMQIILEVLYKETPDNFLRYLAYREGDNKNKLIKLLRQFIR